MADTNDNQMAEVAYLLSEILQTLQQTQADVAGLRKAIENGGDLDSRLGYIEAAVNDSATDHRAMDSLKQDVSNILRAVKRLDK